MDEFAKKRLQQQIDAAGDKLAEGDKMHLLMYSLCEAAADIFVKAGCPDDFCLQLANWDVLVFGGTNRLKWTPKHGFYPDRGYCSQKFLDSFDKA